MFNLTTFKNPESAYRVHPFWFWNGEMDEQEIYHQIMEMAEKGVGGFFICPRQGLTIPYLSEEWFRKVKFATETAQKVNLDVWLYDEYPYPSGIAGGEVILQHPEAKHYHMVHKSMVVKSGEPCSLDLPWGRVLSAKAVPIDANTGKRLWNQSLDVKNNIGNYQAEPVFQKTGLTAYNQKRFFTYKTLKKLNWNAPEGNWEIHCFLEEEIEDFKYYGTFVDPCHQEAIKTFIEVTHERYTDSLGEYFGKTVKGMFTDETGLLGKIPWTPQLLDFFKKTKGYDLADYLHALIDPEDEATAKVRYDYFQSIHLLLRQAYHKQIHDWCENHGLQYVAEVPSVRMTTQLYSHVPGGDSAHEKLGRSLEWILNEYSTSFRANPKMVSSLANQLGRDRALIECFHSIGWSMTLQDAKWMLDRLGAFGINFFNFHAFFYTLNGLTKHDAPPSQFLQNPYWEHFRLLGDYAGRLGYVMSSGTPIRSIAVLDPTTSLWTKMGNPFHHFDYSGDNPSEKEKLDRLKQDWTALCNTLTLHHKSYDHLDPELLAEAEIVNGKISIGRALYSVLVLPPMSNLEAGAWTKIKVFLDQGGIVIANGLLPYESIDTDSNSINEEMVNVFGSNIFSEIDFWEGGSPSNMPKQWTKGEENAYFIPSTTQVSQEHLQTFLSLLEEQLKDDVRFEVEGGNRSFLMEKRKLQDDSIMIFISNQEGGEHHTSLYVEPVNYPDEYTFQRFDLETGDVERLHGTWMGDNWKVDLDFKPFQSKLIQVVKHQERISIEPTNLDYDILEVNTTETWEMSPMKDNALRFDMFELFLNGECSGSNVQVKTFIDQCTDLSNEQKLPLTFNQVFGTPMKMAVDYPVACTYLRTFVIEELPSSCSLLMDDGAISGNYKIFINDQFVTDFTKSSVYDHQNQICDIFSMLSMGENTLRIEVDVKHDWDGVIDALYLLGDFGVYFDESDAPIITKVQTNSVLHRGPYKSLPHYAGKIMFKRSVDLVKAPTTEKFRLIFSDLDKDFHDCMEVTVNGHSLGVRAWTPYEWEGESSLLNEGENKIEVIVTNTLIGFMEGKSFDYEEHKLRPASHEYN